MGGGKDVRIVITSGFFAPAHRGHGEYLTQAKTLGDKLITIVNNDAQVKIKGSKPFMDEYDRLYMVSILKPVDEAILAIDTDISVCKTIEMIWNRYRDNEMIFAKGGDRFVGNIPEVELCKKLGIKIVDGLGAKIRSSSEILAAL